MGTRIKRESRSRDPREDCKVRKPRQIAEIRGWHAARWSRVLICLLPSAIRLCNPPARPVLPQARTSRFQRLGSESRGGRSRCSAPERNVRVGAVGSGAEHRAWPPGGPRLTPAIARSTRPRLAPPGTAPGSFRRFDRRRRGRFRCAVAPRGGLIPQIGLAARRAPLAVQRRLAPGSFRSLRPSGFLGKSSLIAAQSCACPLCSEVKARFTKYPDSSRRHASMRRA